MRLRMLPVLVDLGSFQLHTYGVLGALGFVLGCGVCLWRARALGLDLNYVADVIFWMAVAGVAGARATYVWNNPSDFPTWYDWFDVRGGGLVFYGAVLVGLPVGVGVMLRRRLPVLATFDVLATGFPLGHAISRVGCFAAGCCFGTPTDGPFGVSYPADSPIAPAGVDLHPVQLYEAALLLAITAAVNVAYDRRRFDGQIFLAYLAAYAVIRPVMEAFRGDQTRGFFLEPVLGEALSFSQGISLAVIAGVVALAAWIARRPALTTRASLPAP